MVAAAILSGTTIGNVSRFSKLIEPSNLRLFFDAMNFFADLKQDLSEDLSFAQVLSGSLLAGGDLRQIRPDRVFPPFRPRPVPALRGKRIGLIVSGGSGATASLCGIRRAFEEAGVEIAAVSACSGGVLFASLWACGLSAQEMASFWLSLRSDQYLDPGWREIGRATLDRFSHFGGLLRGAALERTFGRRLHGLTLGQTRIPLYIVVWNIDENRVEYVSTKHTPDLSVARAARIAISIPLFVEPVRYRKHLYGDGGVVTIFPARPLVEFEEPLDLVIGVNCYYRENFVGHDVTGWRNHPWAILRASGQLRSAIHLELAREQMRLLGSRLKLLHPVPHTEVRGTKFYESFLDRSRWPAYMRQGYHAARRLLTTFGATRDRTVPHDKHAA